MSATEVIAEIQKLPREEQEKVYAFVQGQQQPADSGSTAAQTMEAPKAKAISTELFTEHAELFRKLAR